MGNRNGGAAVPNNSGFGVPSSWNDDPSRSSSMPTTLIGRRNQPVNAKLPDVNMNISGNGKAGFKLSALYQLEATPLATGGFGQVFVGRHTRQEEQRHDNNTHSDRRLYAIKIIPKAKISYHGLLAQRRRVKNYHDLERYCSEVQILRRLRADGEPPTVLPVVYLYEVFLTATSIQLVTELLVEELGKWRNGLPECTEKMAIDVCRIVLDAIGFMHQHQVVHRDLKMSNIMFRVQNQIPTLKIVDFGLARILHRTEKVTPESASGRPTRDFFCGTPGHIPPEMYYGRPYRFEVDLFAFGVLVFRLLSGKHPFPYPNDLHMLQRRTIGLEYSVNDEDWIGRSDASKDFIHKLIAQQDDRISLEEAKQHQWFREAGESVLPQDKSYGNQSDALGTSVRAPSLPKSLGSRGRFWIDASLEHALDLLAARGLYSAHIMERRAGEIGVKEIPPPQTYKAPVYIGNLQSYTEKDCRDICRQLVKAIQLMHDSGVAHRHLHIENVLINPQGNVCLRGFRHAKPILPGVPLTGNFDYGKIWWLYAYKAPEIERNFVHDKSVDLWSLGVTMYMLLTSMGPFRGEKDMLVLNKHSGTFCFEPISPSLPAQQLVRRLLQVDPARRATVQEVLDSEWMTLPGNVLDQHSLSLTLSLYHDRLEEKPKSSSRRTVAT